MQTQAPASLPAVLAEGPSPPLPGASRAADALFPPIRTVPDVETYHRLAQAELARRYVIRAQRAQVRLGDDPSFSPQASCDCCLLYVHACVWPRRSQSLRRSCSECRKAKVKCTGGRKL